MTYWRCQFSNGQSCQCRLRRPLQVWHCSCTWWSFEPSTRQEKHDKTKQRKQKLTLGALEVHLKWTHTKIRQKKLKCTRSPLEVNSKCTQRNTYKNNTKKSPKKLKQMKKNHSKSTQSALEVNTYTFVCLGSLGWGKVQIDMWHIFIVTCLIAGRPVRISPSEIKFVASFHHGIPRYPRLNRRQVLGILG